MNLEVSGGEGGAAAAVVASAPVVAPERAPADRDAHAGRPYVEPIPGGPHDPQDLGPRRGVMSTVVHELLEYRDLLWQLTLRDIRIRYAQAVMGLAWAVLMPIVVVLSGLLIRYAMAQHADVGIGRSVIAGIAIKGLLWSFFSSALAMGTMSLVANKHLGVAASKAPTGFIRPCVVHPDTGTRIDGFELPQWEAAVQLAVRAHQALDRLVCVGWDIAILERGPVIIEANDNPGHASSQLPTGIGLGETPIARAVLTRLQASF